jgi:hypothetical protein
MLELAGDTAMAVTTLATCATLSVAVACMPFSEAVIVVEPEATAVARPLELIVATAGVLEAQLAVLLMSAVVLSLYFAVAVNCCVAPSAMLAEEGAIETDASVFVGGGVVEFGGLPPHPRLEIMSDSERPAAGAADRKRERRVATIGASSNSQ